MGFFDSLEKQRKQQEWKARMSYSNKLSSAYHNTDDSAKKSAIAKALKENNEKMRGLK